MVILSGLEPASRKCASYLANAEWLARLPPANGSQEQMNVASNRNAGTPSDVTIVLIVTSSLIKVRCEVCGDRFAAHRRSAKTCSDVCRQRRSRHQRAVTPPFPAGPFDLISADPPWHFTTFSDKGQGKSPSRHYPTMSIDWLCRLAVRNIAAPNSALVLWVYGPRLPDALTVMKGWGFTYKSDLLTWNKMTKTGKPTFGMGYTTRKNTETVIFGTRGQGLKVIDHGVRQGFSAPVREHSRKPDEAFDALERLFGQVRRIELFAREKRVGWDAWGNELPVDGV